MACLTGPPWPRQASATIAAAGLPARLAGEACMCHALRARVWDERLVRASIVMLAWDTHVGASMDIHVHPSSLLWLMWALGCLGVSWLAFLSLHGNVPLCRGHSASYPWQVSGLARAVQACWGVAGWLQNTGSRGQMVGQEAAGEAIGFEEVQACTQQGCAARGVRGVVLPRSNSSWPRCRWAVPLGSPGARTSVGNFQAPGSSSTSGSEDLANISAELEKNHVSEACPPDFQSSLPGLQGLRSRGSAAYTSAGTAVPALVQAGDRMRFKNIACPGDEGARELPSGCARVSGRCCLHIGAFAGEGLEEG